MIPSDVSDEFAVSMDEGLLVLTVGDTTVLSADVTRNGEPAPGIPLRFVSEEPTVAVVEGAGLIRGVSVGQTEVTATAVGLANAPVVSRPVRVLRAVAIEDVRPTVTESANNRTAKWGEVVEIVGVGLDPVGLNLVFVDRTPAPIHSFVPAPAEDESASDTLRIWIPAGVPEQSSVLVSRRGGSTASWAMDIVQEDILEPNDLDRVSLSVPAGGLDHRGLALEVRPWGSGQIDCWAAFSTGPDECWSDGYVVDWGSTGDITLVLSIPGGTFETAPVSVEIGDDFTSNENWLIQQSFSLCYDDSGALPFFAVTDHFFETSTDSLVIALADITPPLFLSTTLYGVESSVTPAPTGAPATTPYDLRIHRGYQTELPADPFEENDHCHLASPLSFPSSSTDLTFDHGRDLDWMSFVVPGTPVDPGAVNEVAETEPNGTFAQADTLVFGERGTGVISTPGDTDYYVFEASSGDQIDIEIRAEREGDSTLNSLLQLFFGGEQIALSDDFSITTFDSRITMRAPSTGTYRFSVQDVRGTGLSTHSYQVDLRLLDSESHTVTLQTSQLSSLPASDFRPFIQIWRDDRATDGNINLLIEDEAETTTVLTPGAYLILTYNKAGRPAEYRLDLSAAPIG
ncbi:MAG: hypothetical protein HKN73_20245 [Gemmatimonadetes bacterium]|nr:hypothetical protein [Gemmatimonadota bacterium]